MSAIWAALDPAMKSLFDLLIGRPLCFLETSYEHMCAFYVSGLTEPVGVRLLSISGEVVSPITRYAIRPTERPVKNR